MGENQVVIKAAELSQMAITCPTCNASFAVDGTRTEWGDKDAACPGCGTHWNGFKDLLGLYRNFYNRIRSSDLGVSFRIKAEEC